MNQKRQPKGTTIGGQFAASKNPESHIDLGDSSYVVTDDWGNTSYYNSDGQRHRDGGLPAYEWADGSKAYYVNGQRHRDGGLPAIEWANGSKEYYVNGQRHRDGGLPAYDGADGTKEYWVNGQRHRDDGPAIEPSDPEDGCQFYLEGKPVNYSEFVRRTAPEPEASLSWSRLDAEALFGREISADVWADVCDNFGATVDNSASGDGIRDILMSVLDSRVSEWKSRSRPGLSAVRSRA